MSVNCIQETSLQSYVVQWPSHWQRSSMGSCAPYTSFRGMCTSTTNTIHHLPSSSPHTPAHGALVTSNWYQIQFLSSVLVCWAVTLCRFVGRFKCFVGINCLDLQGQGYMILVPRRPKLTSSLLWGPHVSHSFSSITQSTRPISVI